jgi:hypothetical protein
VKRQLPVVLIALSLVASSGGALAASQPRVPDEVLSRVPADVRDGWRRQDEDLARLTRELEAARSTRALADSLRAVDAARHDLRATLSVATNLRSQARSALETVRLERVDDRIRLDRAKLEERLATDDLRAAKKDGGRFAVREARALRREARDRRKEEKDALVEARRDRKRTERAAREQLAVAEDGMARAQTALQDPSLASLGRSRRSVSEAELALLEARRDLAEAELEHERAIAVVESGGRLRLRPFEESLEEARDAEGSARQALVRPAAD